MGGPPRPPAHALGGRRARRAATPVDAAIEACLSVQSRAVGDSTGSRCAAATPPGLHLLVWDHGLDLADPTVRGRSSRARRRPAVPVTARCASPTACCRSSTRPRPRSASSATTPPRCAPRSRDDELLRLALAAPTAPGRGARAHPLGERRHHLRAERAPAQPARSSSAATARAVRGRRAQRRRRQLRRPQGRSTACASPAEITTDAKVIPAARVAAGSPTGVDLGRGVPPDGRAFEGSVAIGAGVAADARHRAARAARQRPGAVRRARRRLLHRRQRALRRGRGDDRVPAARRRDAVDRRPAAAARSSCSTAPRAGDARRHPAARLRRHRAAGRPTTTCRRRRSRPATSTAATSRTSC